jgi:hypothetical protein
MKEHSGVGRRLLASLAKTDEDLERAVKAVSDMVRVAQVLYDGIYECVGHVG